MPDRRARGTFICTGAGREGELLTEGKEGLTADFSDDTDEGVRGSGVGREASGGSMDGMDGIDRGGKEG